MSVTSFNVNLFNKLRESTDDTKNIFFSPMSISLALSMLLLGSNGTTKQQLEEALGFKKNKHFHSDLKELNDVLNYNSKVLQIKLANSVFLSEAFKLDANYICDMESAFKSQIQSLDYKKNADESKTIINDWVASSTN